MPPANCANAFARALLWGAVTSSAATVQASAWMDTTDPASPIATVTAATINRVLIDVLLCVGLVAPANHGVRDLQTRGHANRRRRARIPEVFRGPAFRCARELFSSPHHQLRGRERKITRVPSARLAAGQRVRRRMPRLRPCLRVFRAPERTRRAPRRRF